MKRIFAGVLAAALLLAASPAALAVSDLEGNWAKDYFVYLGQIPYKNETGGVIRPNASSGLIEPNKEVTRAEFMRYVNRAFNFTETASISQYTDINEGGWYVETVQIAVKHGYISGTNATTMSPNAPITREQAVTILDRLLKKELPELDPKTLEFTDRSDIGKWSAAYVKDAVESGIIAGYPDGSFRPTAAVTRAEIASMLYHCLGSSLNTAGKIYTSSSVKSDTENVTISAACTLQNAVVQGDLYITEGVATGAVNLTNVTVKGDIIQSGGTVTYNGVTADRMVISSPMGRLVQATATGGTAIKTVEVRSAASLFEKELTGTGFGSVTMNGSSAPSLTLDAAADVTVAQKATVSTTTNAVIGTLTANAAVNVTGYGTVNAAVLNVSGCTLSMEPRTGYTLKSGVTATVAGTVVNQSKVGTSAPVTVTPVTPTVPVVTTPVTPTAGNSISLSKATFDRNEDADAYQDLEVTLVAVDDAVFRKVVLGGVEIEASFSRSKITIDADVLEEIYPGTYTLTYVMSSGVDPTLELTIIDTGDGEDDYDYEAEWSGSKRDDVTFRTAKNSKYSEDTSISSIKYNGNNISSSKFSLKYRSTGKLDITIDGDEIDEWFGDYNYPNYMDFDIKLSDPSETFVLRVWY